MRQLGYIEGENIVVEYRAAEGHAERLPALAAEIVMLEIEVLVALGPASLRAAKQATSQIPIVGSDLESDPIKSGIIGSYNRPGGNVTGLFLDQSEIAGKWLEYLKASAPKIERAAAVWDRNTSRDQLDAAEFAASALGIELQVLEVPHPDEYDDAFKSLGKDRPTGVVQLSSPALLTHPKPYADATLKYRLPATSAFRTFAEAGCLFSLGPILPRFFQRIPVLVDKILNGAVVGNLPIERPDKYELVVNLKTAKALGLEVPPTLLASADEVIE